MRLARAGVVAVLLCGACVDKGDYGPSDEEKRAAKQRAKVELARTHFRRLELAYEEWSARHPGVMCPRTIEELERRRAFRVDPWGTPYELRCGEGVQFGLVSAGPDKRVGTGDDVRSW